MATYYHDNVNSAEQLHLSFDADANRHTLCRVEVVESFECADFQLRGFISLEPQQPTTADECKDQNFSFPGRDGNLNHFTVRDMGAARKRNVSRWIRDKFEDTEDWPLDDARDDTKCHLAQLESGGATDLMCMFYNTDGTCGDTEYYTFLDLEVAIYGKPCTDGFELPTLEVIQRFDTLAQARRVFNSLQDTMRRNGLAAVMPVAEASSEPSAKRRRTE